MEKLIRLNTHEEAMVLCGAQDQNVRFIEKQAKVKITVRGEHLKVSGTASNIKKAQEVIESLLHDVRSGQQELSGTDVTYAVNSVKKNKKQPGFTANGHTSSSGGKGSEPGPKTKGQCEYVQAIKQHDIVFGLGPAGTGKTYLAMAAAVEALKKQEVRRIMLTRPAIEAGESLGFLPGDMIEKISPYLRPLYDAIYDMMEADEIEKHLETGVIEVAPLAYMRGRTLNDAFIILDEAQNCTPEQLKMFLTRLGFDSKAVITGDLTQSDLPEGKPVGLMQAENILAGIEGIKFHYFTGQDVVRHALVQRIIQAYDQAAHSKSHKE